jgi:hypothetical protein
VKVLGTLLSDPVAVEDPRIAQLAAGGKLRRQDYAFSRGAIVARIREKAAKLVQEGKKP